MRNRSAWILTGIVFLVASAPAKAQWRREKWEFTPFAGYETSGSFPINNSLVVDRLRANGNASFGTFLDYSLTESAQFEFMWNRNQTTFSERQVADGLFRKAFHSDIDQFQFGLLYMLRGSDQRLRPYLAGGVGFTHDWNTGATPDRTQFSYGFGGGVKYMVDRHFGLRGDARWLATYENSSTELFCDPFGFCFPARVAHYLNRGNFVGGLVFRF
jgi:opacity protein-like surface antigen